MYKTDSPDVYCQGFFFYFGTIVYRGKQDIYKAKIILYNECRYDMRKFIR